MMPKDVDELRKIENMMLLSRTDLELKQQYEDCLKKCICLELVQIKEFHIGTLDSRDSESASNQHGKYLEVRTTRPGFAAADNKLSSNILFIGQIGFSKMV